MPCAWLPPGLWLWLGLGGALQHARWVGCWQPLAHMMKVLSGELLPASSRLVTSGPRSRKEALGVKSSRLVAVSPGGLQGDAEPALKGSVAGGLGL